jgi:peroxiredoxin
MPVRARLASAALLLLVLFLVAGWLLDLRTVRDDFLISRPTPPRVGSPAPNFQLKDVQTGNVVTLSSFRGRPVWINFWATWCDACKVEMPQMQRMYTRYKAQGLAILGIEVQETTGAVNAYTRSGAFDWTFLLDPNGGVVDRYFVEGVPTHIFVGTDGTIKAIHSGAITDTQMAESLGKIMRH